MMDLSDIYNPEQGSEYKVSLGKIVRQEDLQLLNLTPEIDLEGIYLTHTDVNRPSLQIAGYFDVFSNNRLQVLGEGETDYISKHSTDGGAARIERLFQARIPALIYAKSLRPCDRIIELAYKYNTPVFVTPLNTSIVIASLVYILQNELAPRTTIHGVLMDVFGEGVLITGESGIGKSETAIALIKNGHRLVSDDAVEIKKVGRDLIGNAPELTRYFIELRGIGILDVKTMFGVQSVKDRKIVSLVVNLEEWDKNKEYDRLGMDDESINILGEDIPYYNVPVRPGRNEAIIVESAAINQRQKKMGYNAAKELYNRVLKSLEEPGGEQHDRA